MTSLAPPHPFLADYVTVKNHKTTQTIPTCPGKTWKTISFAPGNPTRTIHMTQSPRTDTSDPNSPKPDNSSSAFSQDPPEEDAFSSEAKQTGKQIDSSQTHYETLSIAPHSSPQEIKKSFYRLSKHHHPDRNPRDSHAPRRFVKISEAYAVLSNAEKRRAYDRSVERLLRGQGHGHGKRGSYQGGGANTRYAGGRPASGLSKRRGHFQGPPPSFFKSGGWGKHDSRRREEHERSTQTEGGEWRGNASHAPYGDSHGQGADGAKWSSSISSSGGGYGEYAGMGPGSDPYQSTRRERYGAKHFNPHVHEQTWHRVAQTTNRPRRDDDIPQGDVNAGVVGNFVSIAMVLFSIIAIPAAFGLILKMVPDNTRVGSGGGDRDRGRNPRWAENGHGNGGPGGTSKPEDVVGNGSAG
ncbi:hypothetical protein MKZ38_010527 [Zalerion maritima]|uniref:J domain-containing protein n=1 Tax=Zalerion maritima TaxID=339359 RepID=A0AAD5RTJ8_9PEZI|nr:hypothetical protein MKZ38_010527 [Zalerion maritima]